MQVLRKRERDVDCGGRAIRYLTLFLIAGLAGFGLSGVAAAQSPDPHFYDGYSEEYWYAPSGMIIGFDVSLYVLNNGGAGDVFYWVNNSGGHVYASKVFGMNTGERIEATTRFASSPGVTLYHWVRTARPEDGDLGDVAITRLDAPPSITIVSPKGGESWYSGHEYRIQWEYTGEPGSSVTLELLNGNTPMMIASGIALGHGGDSEYSWNIPKDITEGSDYRIRITSNSGYTSTSPAPFTIRKPWIDVHTPDGGETWERGKTHLITWNYDDRDSATVGIELYKAGIRVSYIGSSNIGTRGSGSFEWKVPWSVNPASDYTLLVSSSSGAADESDGHFTVSNPAALTVSFPNGGETWYRGRQYTLEWFYPGSLGGSTATVELLKGGAVTQVIVSDIWMSSDGFGFTSWTVPADVPLGSDYSIRVHSSAGAQDESDGVFTIDQPWIRVVTPSGGEQWKPGTSSWIKWEYAGIDWWGNINIELLKAGIVNKVIHAAYPLSMPGYSWAIPSDQPSGSDYTIRITTTTGYSDTSPPFSIGISPNALPGYANPPTDPDGDGLFEDVNGNGIMDYDDAVVLFWNIQWIQNNEPVTAFDFNGNGIMDYDDAVTLFWEI